MVQIYINFIQDLKPKIAIIGYSGVGKTTFVNLVRSSEIPIKHLPSRNCDISTLKIGKLTFFIWDYTGKEQFRFLWEEFIKNSDAIILVTDSTIDNVNKSKFFLDIIKDNPTKPRIIAIANKQDLQNVIGDKQIEKILNLKTYPLKALDISNRDSMIQIIVDILNMRSEVSQQLEFLKEKEKLDNQLKNVLESKKYREAIYLIQNIMDLCLNLGDKALQNDYAKLKEKLTKDLKEEIKLKEDTNTHISPLVQHIEIQNKSNIKSQLRKLLNNYVQEVEGILMSIISDREGNLIIYENKDIDNNEFKSSDIIDISETILTKNKDEMASVLVVCPECQKRKKIQVPRKLIDEATNIITLSIPKKLVCEHNLQVYVDKNMMVRGYQRVDYEYDRYIDKIINEFSLKGDFCNIVTTENKKIAYCSKGPKSLLITLAMLSCRDVELRVYTEHVATKVELILAGTDNIDVQIPQIIRSISKTRGGELPKGHFSVKIIMTGNYQAGKSSLTKKFVQNQFHKNYQSTIGVDITEKLLEISNETKISFMIWDIGGQITHMAPYRNKFYEGANAAFIVIDRTRRDHLNSVELWYNDIKKYVKKNLDVILIGNKSDLLNEIVINDEDIKKVADQFGFHYILTSAKTGENVNDAFSYIAYKYLENI